MVRFENLPKSTIQELQNEINKLKQDKQNAIKKISSCR